MLLIKEKLPLKFNNIYKNIIKIKNNKYVKRKIQINILCDAKQKKN